jgi:putative MATE family efflux protein
MDTLVESVGRRTPAADRKNEAAAPAPDAASARPRLLLEGPVFRTIIRLAAPNVVGSLAQISAGVVQMYFIGQLGVDALSGVTLVFPFLSLMQLVSSSGIGPGVSSAVARSLGAGRRADAEALVLNAVVLAIAFGIIFTVAELVLDRVLYRSLGGSDAVLAASLAYSHWVFGAAVLVWTLNLLVCALIGSGNTVVPQIAALFFLVVVPLSPALMFGWGPLPRLGIAGAGLAFACYYIVATTALVGYFRSRHATLKLPLDLRLVEWRLLREILRVGGPSAVSTMIPAISLMLITAAVARFGTDAVAGFGIAMRMDYLLLPLYFGICAGVLPMVGANVGAGQIRRARLIAWTGALIGAGIGSVAALFLYLAPWAWVSLFSSDANVIASGSLYLSIVGLQYPLTALGIVLGAAAQGSGRPLWPLAAGIARATISAGGSWFVVAALGGPVEAVFATLAIGGVAYCGILTAAQVMGQTIPDRSRITAGAPTEPAGAN